MQTSYRYIAAGLLVLLIGTACQKRRGGDTAGSNQGSGQSAAGSGSAQVSDKTDEAANRSTASGSASGSAEGSGSAVEPAKDIDSKDILARTETTPDVHVKHVLIGWKELAASYRGQMDPRAAKRGNAEAAKLAEEVATKLKANPDSINALIKESSEDTASLDGEPYEVKE